MMQKKIKKKNNIIRIFFSKRQNGFRFFDFFGGILLLMFGIGLFTAALAAKIPELKNLTEINGHLESYYFLKHCNRHCGYMPIITLQEGNSFWTTMLGSDKITITRYLNTEGLEIKYYIDPNSKAKPINNAVKVYGLWINGKEITSAQQAIDQEEFIVHVSFPLLGIFFLYMAIFVCLQKKKMKA